MQNYINYLNYTRNITFFLYYKHFFRIPHGICNYKAITFFEDSPRRKQIKLIFVLSVLLVKKKQQKAD